MTKPLGGKSSPEPIAPYVAAHRQATAQEEMRRIRWVDGLRGLAACDVVVSHCWDTWKVTGHTASPQLFTLTQPLGLGRWAVSLFIVLSGVSLGLPVWRGSRTWPGGVRAFLFGRFKRIVPTYWVAVAISASLAATVLSGNDHSLYDQANNIRPLGVLVNLGLLQDLLWRGPAGSTAFWSIAVEVQIYLVFAVTLALWRRLPGSCWAVSCVIFTVVSVWSTDSGGGTARFTAGAYPGLFALFFLGVGASRFLSAQWSSRGADLVWYSTLAFVASAGMIGVGANGWQLNVLGPAVDLLVGPIIGLVVGELARGRLARLAAVLSVRLFVWLGASSYSLYLIHAVVIECVWRLSARVGLPAGSPASLIVEVMVGLVASIGAARFFYLGVERRFMNNRPESSTVERGKFAGLRRSDERPHAGPYRRSPRPAHSDVGGEVGR